MSLPADLERQDIGSGVWMHRITGGVIVGHTHPDGAECAGSVLFDCPELAAKKAAGVPLWRKVVDEPLTVSPAIISPECGLKGWITEGRWVPCDKGEYRSNEEGQAKAS